MVLSEEQTKLINEEDAASEKKKGSASAKRVNNSKELYAKIQEITAATQKIVEETNGTTMRSVQDLKGTTMKSVQDLKASTDVVATTVIDIRDELTKLSDEFIILSNRLDDIQGPVDIEESVSTPQPAEAEQIQAGDLSRDALDNFKKQISARDAELSNKKFSNLMERMCLMREDYATLTRNIRKDVNSFTAAEVLSSFEAYLIDMENMLYDAGIVIGPYGKDGDQVDVAHQRIVGIVNTTDPSKNGTVATRLTDGYEYNGRALVKEKVNVYKVAEPAPKKSEDEIMEILG